MMSPSRAEGFQLELITTIFFFFFGVPIDGMIRVDSGILQTVGKTLK